MRAGLQSLPYQRRFLMKLSSRFSLFLNLPLLGGACLLALCSCGDKEEGERAAEEKEAEKLSPVESLSLIHI